MGQPEFHFREGQLSEVIPSGWIHFTGGLLYGFKAATLKGPTRMCDYSLEHVESRAAKVGDQLVTTIFPNALTRGFTAQNDPTVAVCLLPGTELVFDRDVESDHALGFFPTKKMGENTARFRRIRPDSPLDHHDALEFPSGRIVLLTRLVSGQRATVLQLPVVEPKPEAEPQANPEAEPKAQPAHEPAETTAPAAA